MSNIADIEAAIERLPAPQQDQLARWFEQLRTRRAPVVPVEKWLETARGAARAGVTTDDVIRLSRGEE
jgi:hypothetical protein